MTDRSEADRMLDTAITRLVTDAGADAPASPDAAAFEVTQLTGPTRRSRPNRWATAGAIGLTAAVAAALVMVVIDNERTTTVRPFDSEPPQPSATISTQPSGSEPIPTSTTSTEPSTTTTIDTTPRADLITRPVVAAEVCEATSAWEGATAGVTLFARPSANPIPIQIIGDPVAGPTGPFALVERFFGDGYAGGGTDIVEVNGFRVRVSVYNNGNGVAMWDLGDGSQGYVRSRGLDRDALVGIIGSLTARPATDPIPGFDFTPPADTPPSDQETGLQLLHEKMNTDITGEVARSECHVPQTGYVYWISAIFGDPVFQYGGVIDRPPPIGVGVRNGTLIVINGTDAPAAPTVDDVVDADPATWLDLRSRRNWPVDGTRVESISDGVEVVLALVPSDVTTSTSYVTLRLAIRDGATFLEVDNADAVLAADAAFWRIEIDGRLSISTAHVGSVMGVRVGDAPHGIPIDVTVSIIDGGDFVLQTTGPVQLVPQP